MLIPINNPTTSHHPYASVTADFANPLNNQIEPLTLVFYQMKKESRAGWKSFKHQSAIFFDQAGNDIPVEQWTAAMETFFQQQKVLHPVPKQQSKISLWFKLLLLAAVAMVIWGAGFIGYKLLIEPEKQETLFAELSNPKAGDLYFVGGVNFLLENPSTDLHFKWIKVLDVKNDRYTIELLDVPADNCIEDQFAADRIGCHQIKNLAFKPSIQRNKLGRITSNSISFTSQSKVQKVDLTVPTYKGLDLDLYKKPAQQ